MAIKEINYNEKKFELSYIVKNPDQEKAILILHGWGSNKEIMQQAFGNCMKELRHIYLDMPGFGNSPNENILTTNDYANIVKLFLEEINTQPIAIAGHSFGGKVATLLNPPNLILLSSAGILVPKPFKIKAKIAITKFFNKLGLKAFRKLFVADDAKGMNEGMYETFKNVVNEDFENNFNKVTSNALLFWGKSDTATPLWTAKKIDHMLKSSTLYELEGDHFFFLQHSKFICDKIVEKILR